MKLFCKLNIHKYIILGEQSTEMSLLYQQFYQYNHDIIKRQIKICKYCQKMSILYLNVGFKNRRSGPKGPFGLTLNNLSEPLIWEPYLENKKCEVLNINNF